MKLRTLGLLAAAVAGLALGTSAVNAAAVITVSDGTSLITINDNNTVGSPGIGVDSNSGATGSIVWAGSFAGWSLVVTSGVTKPLLGTATNPAMDLGITATGGPGNLFVAFSDNGFGPYVGGLTLSLSVNNVNETQTAQLFGNSANTTGGVNAAGALVGGGSLLATVGPLSGLATGLASGTTAGLGTNYSLTTYVAINASAAGGNSSDTRVVPVPVPAAAWMGLSTLAGVGGMGLIRRRRKA